MRRQTGSSLLEALVALAAASLGLVVLAGAQASLHLQADVVRERAEAVRLAEGEVERLRSFDSGAAWSALAALPATEAMAGASNTSFVLQRQLAFHDSPGWLATQVRLQWTDRHGQPASVTLRTTVAGTPPSLSGRLALPPRLPGATGTESRSAGVPPDAVDLGDGRSRWQPPGTDGLAWVFDNASGEVVADCRLLADGTLADCSPLAGWTVRGEVAFATGEEAGTAEAQRPPSPALDLDLQLTLHAGLSATCVDDSGSPADARRVRFSCLVVPAPSGVWSGRLDVQPVGRPVADGIDAYRVCRYSADYDRRNGIANAEHPLDYESVAGPLSHQNFLVIRGDHACPVDTPSDPAHGHTVDASTVEQAPHPTPTPPA